MKSGRTPVGQKDKETDVRSFTFNYSIAHCVGDGRKRKRERDEERERAKQLKIAQVTHTPFILFFIWCLVIKQAE